MRTLFKLVILTAVLVGAYFYFVPGASLSDFSDLIPKAKRLDPATGKPLIPCRTCKATGQVKCTARKCEAGTIECNGPCMRLSKGIWIKDAKLGHGPDELWMGFRQKSNTYYWSSAHVGEVVEMRDGMAVLIGACKICNKTTRMPCPVCKGTALDICKVCKGRKEIPDMSAVSAKAAASPAAVQAAKATPPPSPSAAIRLKNGTTITGKIVIKDADFVEIRTADGKTTQIATKDLARP